VYWHSVRDSRLIPPALLACVLLTAARLHWIYAQAFEILPDDILLMGVSRKIAGDWSEIRKLLWTPQHIHVLPLFRLLRLPFDLHFPAWYAGFHAVVEAAHLASAALLYALARRYLRSPWAALATAASFAWSTAGDEALAWKAASPFALSWTFLLLGIWLLTQNTGMSEWIAAASLLGSVGLFSGALFALPGVIAAVALLEPAAAARALRASGAAWTLGAVSWLALVPRSANLRHYWRAGGASAGVLLRLAWAARDTLHSSIYQFGLAIRVLPGTYRFSILFAVPALILAALWSWTNLRWVLASACLTLPPLFVIMLVRAEPEVWKISRYAYQSFTLWAMFSGAVWDGLQRKWQKRPRLRLALALAAPALALCYLSSQLSVARHHRDELLAQPINQPAFWFGWDAVFHAASQRSLQAGKPMRIPFVQAIPGLELTEVYRICEPRGLPGLFAEHGVAGSAAERAEWERAIEQAHVPLPGWSAQ
jgi:hypothetical protein